MYIFSAMYNRVGEISSPLSHHQYVPFGIRRFNITSKHDSIALCAFSFPFPWIRPMWCSS